MCCQLRFDLESAVCSRLCLEAESLQTSASAGAVERASNYEIIMFLLEYKHHEILLNL